MGFNRAWRVMQVLVLFAAIPQARAQGTVEDYQRAQSFLPGNLRHRVFLADVQANWIEKTSTFWYRRVGQTQTEFILVDAERNTSAPAFDHSRLAAGLSRAAKRAYDPSRLPFDSFEFVQSGKPYVSRQTMGCGFATSRILNADPAHQRIPMRRSLPISNGQRMSKTTISTCAMFQPARRSR